MKKIIAISLAMMFLAAVCIPVSAHDLTWDAVGGSAGAIDGIKDDAWANAQSVDVKAWGGEEGAWANVSVMYDEDSLYFFAKVYDKIIDVSAADPGDGSARDCIGFCMDFDYIRTPDNNFYEGEYAGYAGYVNIGADSNIYFNCALDNDTFKGGTEYKVVTTADGYDVEIKFPITYKVTDRMGIEFFVNDAQGEGVRATYCNWETSGVDSWCRTDTMGTLIFKPIELTAPEAPAEDAIEVPEAPAAVEDNSSKTNDSLVIVLSILAVSAVAAVVTGRKLIKSR